MNKPKNNNEYIHKFIHFKEKYSLFKFTKYISNSTTEHITNTYISRNINKYKPIVDSEP